MAASLPSNFALQLYADNAPSPHESLRTHKKYLGCGTGGELQGQLEYSFAVLDQSAKFAMEPSKHGGGLVHIRSCNNNKYWVRASQDSPWIVAKAIKPKENVSVWNCTLFKPITVVTEDNRPTVKFRHYQLKTILQVGYNSAQKICLCIHGNPPGVYVATSRVVDYDSLVKLPKRIAFLGDNGRYLQAHVVDDRNYLEYSSTDLGSQYVGEEVFTTDDGYYRFKNIYYGKFWRRSPNWIWADSADTSINDLDTLFEAVKVKDDDKGTVIALRNMGNKQFCKRLTTEGKDNCLNAAINSITIESQMTVVEPVLWRSITVDEYRLGDVKFSDRTPVIVATDSATNPTDTATIMTLEFSYTQTTTRSWTNTFSIKLGIKATLSAKIPLFAEGKTEISTEVTNQYQWGESKTESISVKVSHSVDVPARSKLTVNMIANRATCTIPFSYTQVDQFTSGKRLSLKLEDGVFTGVDSIEVEFRPEKSEPLPSELWE